MAKDKLERPAKIGTHLGEAEALYKHERHRSMAQSVHVPAPGESNIQYQTLRCTIFRQYY